MTFRSIARILMLAAAAAAPLHSAAQKFTVDKVVANVGTSVILYSEMDAVSRQFNEERKERGYTSDRDPMNEALEYLLMQKLLYNQAQIDSVEINEGYIMEMVEQEVGLMVAEEGSVAALERRYSKPIFDIKRQLQQRYEEVSYAQNMRYEVVDKVTITPGEVEKFFRSIPRDSLPIIPEQYVYAQITKYPGSTKEAKQRVRESLLELRERIINGTRFDMLARMYSEDPGTAVNGGEMGPAPLESFVTPFANALQRLRPGQISEVVETEYGYHLIELMAKDNDMYTFRHILLRPQFTFNELNETDRYLDSLAHKIRVDSVSFAKAAFDHSDDKYTKNNGGLVSNHEILEFYEHFDVSLSTTKFFKEDLQPDVFRVLSTLKPGEISDAFQSHDMRSNVHSKILKLNEIIPAHTANLREDYLQIEELALDAKKNKHFNEWLLKKIDAMYIRIDPEYRDGEFELKAWLK